MFKTTNLSNQTSIRIKDESVSEKKKVSIEVIENTSFSHESFVENLNMNRNDESQFQSYLISQITG